MGTAAIVVEPPRFDDAPGIGQTDEPVLIQTLIAQPAVETLYDGVLDRFARLNAMAPNPTLVRPLVEHLAGQFRPVIQHELVGLPACLS